MIYYATFVSHYDAMVYLRALKSKNITAKMVPVPRKLSSSCGSSVCFETDSEISSITEGEVTGIYSFISGNYKLVYESAD